jgi:hypothetical protein
LLVLSGPGGDVQEEHEVHSHLMARTAGTGGHTRCPQQ